MDPNINLEVWERIAKAFDGAPFVFAFLSGFGIIAFYSWKRVGELIDKPRGEEFDFVRTLSLATMVGDDTFRKAYSLYIGALSLLYILLCSLQPIYLVLSNDPKAATFQGSAWPLGAALLVVGVLPSFPFVAQIESALRSLAHSVARIPAEFYDRVERLTTQEIEALVRSEPEYRTDLNDFREVSNILLLLNFPQDESVRMARKITAAKVFSEWTLNGREIWSGSEINRYTDVLNILTPKSDALAADKELLVKATLKSPMLKMLMAEHGIADLSVELEAPMLDILAKRTEALASGDWQQPTSTVSASEVDSWLQLGATWKKLANESEIVARRLSALFAMLARNDRMALRAFKEPVAVASAEKPSVIRADRKKDPVLRKLIGLLEPEKKSTEPWYNALWISILASAGTCFLVLGFYLAVVDALLTPSGASTLIRDALKGSASTTFSMLMTFAFAGLTALFLQSEKTKDSKWTSFQTFRQFPVIQYLTITLAATAAAFLPSIVTYVLFYVLSDDIGRAQFIRQQPEVLLQTLFYKLISCIIPAFFAVSLCIVKDLALSRKEKRYIRSVSLRLSVLIAATGFVVLLFTPGYSLELRVFWHHLAAWSIFSALGLFFFLEALAPSAPRESIRPMNVTGATMAGT